MEPYSLEHWRESIRNRVVVGPKDCWLPIGQNGKGYPKTTWKGRSMKLCKLSYMAFKGPVAPGLWVLHHCDVKPCINPEHLYLGGRRENTDDAVARGLLGKLTAEKVVAMREMYKAGALQREVALKFGVCLNEVNLIVSGKLWNHVGGPTGLRPKLATHCQRGNELTPENTERDTLGKRRCKICRRKKDLARYYANREAMNKKRMERLRAFRAGRGQEKANG